MRSRPSTSSTGVIRVITLARIEATNGVSSTASR
jgi:hypothetical protein